MTKRGSEGQALVLCLLLAGAAALASLLLFNSGMLANTKTQLQNAADAGAYSGAVMLARDHNFSAYSNRAMVANQVAVAQLVSLDSYLEDAAKTHGRLNDLVQSIQADIPTSKGMWDAGKKHRIEDVNNAYVKIAGPAVRAIDALIRAFDTAQHLHHETTAASVMFIVDEVVQKNDPHASVSTGKFQTGTTLVQVKRWRNDYTARHRANDNSAAADRFANVVVSDKSTDGFTRSRLSVPLPAWSSTPKPWYCPLGIPQNTTFGFVHSGGTILSRDKKRWLALDATMGAGVHVCEYITFWGPVIVTVPLIDPSSTGLGGSGGAVAGRGGRYGESTGFSGNPLSTRMYGYALINPLTLVPAQVRYQSTGPGATLDANGGLQDNYRDIAATAATPLNQAPERNGAQIPLTVEVQRGQDSVRTSSQFLGGATNIRLDPALKGGTMRSLAAAQAFFYRPKQDSSAFTRNGWQRADNRAEMASLFNPYWQARLSDRSDAERLLSIGLQ